MQELAHEGDQPTGRDRKRHRAEGDQLEAVHEAQRAEEHQHGHEREQDVGDAHQRRIFKDTIASLRGREPSSTATAPPTETVRSSADSSERRTSNCPPMVP